MTSSALRWACNRPSPGWSPAAAASAAPACTRLRGGPEGGQVRDDLLAEGRNVRAVHDQVAARAYPGDLLFDPRPVVDPCPHPVRPGLVEDRPHRLDKARVVVLMRNGQAARQVVRADQE